MSVATVWYPEGSSSYMELPVVTPKIVGSDTVWGPETQKWTPIDERLA